MASTNFNNPIFINKEVANIDYKYGPYNSKEEAFDYLYDLEMCAIGLTVGILTEDGIQEYWFKHACNSADDLILKQISNMSEVLDALAVLQTSINNIAVDITSLTLRMSTLEEAQDTDEWDEL